MKNKRNIAILAAVTLTASLVVGSTLAYFYDKNEVKNPFTMAGTSEDTGVDLELTEPGYDPEESKDMLPGDVIVKDPTIENKRGDSYARFIVKFVEKDTDTIITDEERANRILSTLFYDKTGTNIDVNSKYSTTDMAGLIGADVMTPVNNEFTLDSSRSSTGLYYYNYTTGDGILHNGEIKKLFTNIVIPTNWSQTEIDPLGNYDIIVQAEAIQSANFANAAEAFDALDVQ